MTTIYTEQQQKLRLVPDTGNCLGNIWHCYVEDKTFFLLLEVGLLVFKTLIKMTHCPPEETGKRAWVPQVGGCNCVSLTYWSTADHQLPGRYCGL